MSFPTPSFSGARYVLTFIDDFSRCTWVYFLKYKSDVFDSFHVFKTFVEKKFGLSIWRVRIDNGGSM
jgi:5'-3' exoribonuclease 2